MAIDAKTLAASKKYTVETVEGAGAIKGKNCTIDSIVDITGGHRVTFKWTLDNGTVQTNIMDVMDGEKGDDGLGIASVDINASSHLIVTYDDGTTHDAGYISGGGGGAVASVNGKTGEVVLDANDVGAVPTETGKGLSTNDYTNADKNIVDNIPLDLAQLAGSLANKANIADIPTKLSDLTNDSNFVEDANYIHTDNNYTDADKAALAQIPLDISALQGSVLDVKTALNDKVDKVSGKDLSTNDFTNAEKQKLEDLLGIKSIGTGLNFNTSTGELEATGAAITIDPTLDPTSSNAIQNQAIAIPFAALQGSVLGIKNDLDDKVDKVVGKDLSTNDFTDADKQKLDNLLGIESIGTGLNFNTSTGELSATGAAITIDPALDPTSANAIQNQAIAIPFAALQGSVLGIKNDLDDKVDKVAGKDLSDNNYSDADKAIVDNIPLDISALQGSILGIKNDLDDKVDKVAGKDLSDNNYSDADKTIVDNIPLEISQLQASMLTKANTSDIPTNLSELTNDSNYIQDSSYVHTDNNYDNASKSIVDNIPLAIDQLNASLLNKVDKVAGKDLSTNDFTDELKNKTIALEPIYLIGSGLTLDGTTGKLSATGMSIEIDDHLDNTSVHPVQNKVVTAALDDKVDKVTGKGLSDNNYSNADKAVVDNIPLEIAQLQASILTKADASDIPTKFSDLTNDGNYVQDSSYVHTDNNYDNAAKSVVDNLPTFGTVVTKDIPASGDAASTEVVMGDDSRLTDARTPVSHTHTTSDISNFPTLGTAASKDVAASGNASGTEVVMGNDTRLSDSRPASDVSAWAKASSKPSYTASEVGAIPTTDKGANNGVATLDSSGKVPSSQLPSYVDDVIEYASLSAFPVTGESGKIYIAQDTNKQYRWSGTTYVEISESLALGTTSSTAYAGDKGKANADNIATIQGLIPSGATTSNKLATAADIPSLANYVQKSNTAGLLKNDGTVDTNTYLTASGITGKADKVASATNGDFAALDANGNLKDSGYKSSDFLTSASITGKADKVASATNGDLAALDANGNLKDSGAKASDFASTSAAFLTGDTTEANLADADTVPFYDDSASGKRKSTWANIKAKLKAYFDTIYSTLTIGTTSTTAAAGNHTHGVSIASSTGSASSITLASNTEYDLTAGGQTITFKTPVDNNTTYGVVSKTANGLAPQLPNETSTTKYLRQDGTWVAPPGAVTSVAGKTGAVTLAASDVGLGNVGNFKAVSTVASQGLTSTEQSNARANIGAGTSNLALGSSSTTAAAGDHTHSASLATDSGTATISLAANTTYKLTAGGSSIIFKTPVDNNTTYSSKAAASGGTDVSLVTTGEKYTWNNKSNLAIGTTSTTAAAGNHTHGVSIAADSGTSALTMAANTKYKLTAGGNTFIFTTPPDSAPVTSVAGKTGAVTLTASDVGLGNVGNFKAVSTAASQGLSTTEQSNARANIGAGTSSLAIGTTSTTAAAGNHTHTASIASDTGTPAITLAANSIYKLTAGGSSVIFKTHANDGNNRKSFYGTCSTAAGTAQKDVTLGDTSGWELKAGTIVAVKFTNTNSYSATASAPCTLNVNSSGAKNIFYNGSAPTGTNTTAFGSANMVNVYMYDGTNWVWIGHSSDWNTNNAVTQTADDSTNSNFEVIFSNTADNTTRTEGSRKSSKLKFNPSTGNLQATQLNGVTIGSSPKFTDTTYSSQAAASGGTAVSLCTTGEKYTWNNKANTSALDGWTATATVDSNNQVTFSGLNDNYGYELYCQNKLIGISAMSKSGSGTSVSLTYTVTGAATGDVCKLRILK